MTEFINEQGRRRHHDTGAALPDAGPQSINDKSGPADNDSVTEVPDYDVYERAEEEAYRELVDDGGRPLYQIHLLRDVLDDPEMHKDMLQPFWCHPRIGFHSNEIFQKQLKRWQDFRLWQLDNRGLKDADDSYEAYVAKVKRECTRMDNLDGQAKIDADPSDLSWLESEWQRHQRKRNWERAFRRERGCHQLSEYQIAAHARLTKHGYGDLRRESKLDEDPKRQDALATWIEYLGFECWWQDYYARRLGRLQPAHDAAWAKLQDSGHLLPNETAESVLSHARGAIRSNETKQNHEAYLVAEEAVASTRSSGAAQMIVQKAVDRLERAKASLDRTLDCGRAIWAFIQETKAYRDGKEDMERQPALVDWAAQQVALVREEMQRPEDPATTAVTTLAAPTSAAPASASRTLVATTAAAAPTSASRTLAATTSAAPALAPAPTCRFLKRKSRDDNNDSTNDIYDDGSSDKNDNNDNIPKRRKISLTAAATSAKSTTTPITTARTAKPRRPKRQAYTQDESQDTTATDITIRQATVPTQGLRRSARIKAKSLRQGKA